MYFNLAEIFGPPEQKFLKYLDRLEIFYPPVILTQYLLVWQPDVAYFYYWSGTSVRVRLGITVRVRFWVRI